MFRGIHFLHYYFCYIFAMLFFFSIKRSFRNLLATEKFWEFVKNCKYYHQLQISPDYSHFKIFFPKRDVLESKWNSFSEIFHNIKCKSFMYGFFLTFIKYVVIILFKHRVYNLQSTGRLPTVHWYLNSLRSFLWMCYKIISYCYFSWGRILKVCPLSRGHL